MSSEPEITVEEILARTRQAGLNLTLAEAEGMLAGVRRNEAMKRVVRTIVEEDSAPAFVFGPRRTGGAS